MPFLCYSEEIVPFRHLEKSPDLMIATGSELSQGFKTKGFSRASEVSGTNKKELQSLKKKNLNLKKRKKNLSPRRKHQNLLLKSSLSRKKRYTVNQHQKL